MNHKDLDLVKLSKLTTHHIDHVTCLECCKYYIAPATAACGHTLCHTCWRGRRTCPVCASSLDRKTLKSNLQLQTLTNHVQTLSEAFEQLFNVKLNEFVLDTPGELESEKDPNKNVTEWLASSQNQFSSPLMPSQQSTQGLQTVTNPLEISARNIQIHSEVKRTASLAKVIHKPSPQNDWDKIEPMPDPDEGNKNKENVVGPMDIEPFFVDDTEYTSNNPRRSSRKREMKHDDDGNLKACIPTTTKHSSRDSSGDNEKKSEKSKQTWNNVKKMRKEFSKLNKKNKSKLNVSIEMVKKTENLKPTNAKCVNTQQIFNIDDNTPDTAIKDVETNKAIINEHINNDQDAQSCKGVSNSSYNDKKVVKSQEDNISVEYSEDKNRVIANDVNIENNKESISHDPQDNCTCLKHNIHHKMYPDLNNINKNQPSQHEETRHTKMPFIKKSALMPKHEAISIYANNSQASANTDDIEITIKIGNTVTNIVIKKKDSDVQVKVNTDREVQTSLGNNGLNDGQQSSDNKNRNVDINLNNNPIKTPEPVDIISNRCGNTHTSSKLNKSVSTKKNTASAETETAQFEITESVEKELSNIMECEETPEEKIAEVVSSGAKPALIHTTQNKHKHLKQNEFDDLNDLDIFGSGSVKETNVQLLKETATSEILVSTVRSKFKTQFKISEKRDRDYKDDDALPKHKKMKTTQEQNITENIEPDSEPINYDAVMGKVFANIDADIEVIRKSQCLQNMNTSTERTTKNVKEKPKCIISQTQTQINEHYSNGKNVENSHSNLKHSEMVFSMIEKDDENSEVIRNDKIPQQVEELLTPVMCRNLNLLQESQEPIDKTCKSRRKSLQDNYDSDKSIEETPQKNILLPKLKRASTTYRELNQSHDFIETKKIPSQCAIENKSVIDLADTLADSTKQSKDVTVVDTAAKKIILDTPHTITKFVDQIKHKSTPVARKSLNFDHDNDDDDDPEQTLCPSSVIAKTTQEKEFLRKAFEKTPTSVFKSLSTRNIDLKSNKKLCLAGSCLSPQDITKIKYLCNERNWTYVDKYTKELTHLVVGVDEDNKSQRSVKYMCALAASKWIVSIDWVQKCLLSKDFVDEELFEALDSTGEPGPRRSRLAENKLFEGMKFYCMPPFSVLDVDTLKSILVAAGGQVVSDVTDVRVSPDSCEPALLLAEPEHTQEDRFIYLTMELSVVPVNYEWVLNCLGSHNLGSIHELLLCPSGLLPPATAAWPEVLLAQENV